jgi:formylmethanofuran dehydrogenase subunit E
MPFSFRDWHFLFSGEDEMRDFESLLKMAVERHGHLCAGQVLGVRMAQRALAELGIDPERDPKRLIVYIEIDRCATDAIGAVTGCSLGKRTLKHVDYAKMAATFIDTHTDRAVRVVALDSARDRAAAYVPAGLDKHQAELAAYQAMPDEELFDVRPVHVTVSEFDRPGRPVRRVACVRCGEGINDGREVVRNGQTLCRACADQPYYDGPGSPVTLSPTLQFAAVKS